MPAPLATDENPTATAIANAIAAATQLEQYITTHNADVRGAALAAGALPPQHPALLIEPAAPRPPPPERAALIERVWHSTRGFNGNVVIDKALVLVTTPDRPLVRDARGRVRRGASAALYAAELEALRAGAQLRLVGGDAGVAALPPVVDPGEIVRLVQESVSAVMGWPHEEEGDEEEEGEGEGDCMGEERRRRRRPLGTFFERGMDSGPAVLLARVLRRGLRRADVAVSMVYCYPTVSGLTGAIIAAAAGDEAGAGGE